MCVVAAAASWLRGGRYVYQDMVAEEAAAAGESIREGVGA
jgi:hypothetical protein